MVGNFLSNAGLASQGMNQASIDQQNLAQAQQKTKAGEIGLEDIQREDLAAKALRQATANADPDTGIQGALSAYANQQKANGDLTGYQATVDASQNHAMQVATRLAQATAYGLPTDQTEQYLTQNMGKTFVPGSLQYGTDPATGKHIASVVDAKTNQRVVVMPDALGFLSAQQQKVKLGAGEQLVSPLTGQAVANNPEAAATGNSDIYMKTGPQAGQVTQKGGPRRVISNITRTNTGSTSVANPKDLPVLKAIQSSVMNNPGLGTIDRATGKIVGNEVAQSRVADAQSIYLNDRTIPPGEAANAVNFGKRATGPNGEKAYFYNGRMYKLATSGQQVPQASAPAPQQNVEDEEVTDTAANYARGGKVSGKGLC